MAIQLNEVPEMGSFKFQDIGGKAYTITFEKNALGNYRFYINQNAIEVGVRKIPPDYQAAKELLEQYISICKFIKE